MPALHSHIRPLAAPAHDFAALGVGDTLTVALNGREPWRVWQEVASAARLYRLTRNPRFAWRTTQTTHWLIFERRPDADIAPHLRAQAARKAPSPATMDA